MRWKLENQQAKSQLLPVSMTPHQIWVSELSEDSEHLRKELGVFLKMRDNINVMPDFRNELTDIIQHIMTILHQERDEVNSEK